MNGFSDRIREGFPGQRLVIVPANVIQRARELPLVSRLYVTHIGNYPKAPHHYVERETGAEQTILIYCTGGRGWLEMDHQRFEVRPGHLLTIPADTPHRYGADPDDPWAIFWIHVAGAQAAALAETLGVSRNSPLLFVPDLALMQQTFEDLYATLNYHYSDAGLLAMTGELTRLAARIKQHWSHPEHHRRAAEDHVLETMRFMQDHLDMPLTLKTLAARAGQSVPHYCKLFKQRTGQSPMAYFIQLKVIKACALLGSTDQSIRDIARELGYDDPYYFSRLFKKVQGCSPSAYRASIREERPRPDRKNRFI
ncbi:MAG TPA: AraC family transcriptional regulator [Tichowtungia sp.]|nr:AraC family transcriptional regulator [Tichowtungia sp.]